MTFNRQISEISKAFNVSEDYGLRHLRVALRSSLSRRDKAIRKAFGTDRCSMAESNEQLPYNINIEG